MSVSSPEGDGPPRLSVAKAVRSGMVWNAVNFLGSQASGFIIFIILANRLSPAVFGVVAIAAVVSDVVASDGRSACCDAIVQSNRYDRTSLNSAFFTFSTVAILVAAVMAFGAGYAAEAFEAPLLARMLPWFALMLTPIAWFAVTDALILRNLGFRQLTQRNILGTVLGGLAGIAVAFTPWFIWALVVQRMATLIVTAGFVYRLTKWLPGLSVNRERIADFLRRFFPIWMIATLNQVGSRSTALVFGLRYDAATVGLLRVAQRLSEAIQGPLVSPLISLWFPLMSKVRGDPEGERQVHNAILRTAAFLALPVFAGFIVVADDVTTLLLPDTYAGATALIRAISAVALLIPLAWFTAIGLTSLGMNKAASLYSLANVACSLAALLAAPNVTPAQAILISSSPSILMAIIGNAIINRRLGQSNLEHYAGLAPAVLAATAMAAATWAMHLALSGAHDWARLVACVVTGATVYSGWLTLFHRRWLGERIALLKGRDVAYQPSVPPPEVVVVVP